MKQIPPNAFRLLCSALLVIASGSISTDVFAQSLRAYDFKSKLHTSTITSMEQDDLGFIWVGYDNGIARFDGYTAEPFTPTNDSVSLGYVNLLFNRGQTLYVGTNEGLFVCDYVRNTLEPAADELRRQNIVALMVNKNGMWFVGTNNGLFVFDAGWKLLRRITSRNGLSDDRITCIGSNADETLWVGTELGLDLIRLNGEKTETTSLSKGKRIAGLFFDSHRNIWVCEAEEIRVGIAREVEMNGRKSLHHLAYDTEAVSFLQQKNKVWIGTRGAGISQFEIRENALPVPVNRIQVGEDKSDDLKNTILDLHEDDYRNVWISTLDGLYMYKGEKESFFHTVSHDSRNPNTPSSNIISSIYCDADNTLWLATANGINKLTWKDERHYTFSRYADDRDPENAIANNKMQTIIAYKDRTFLVSTKSSVKFFDSRSGRFHDHPQFNDSLAKYGMKYVRDSFRDADENVWLAFSEGGIGVIDTANERFHKLRFPQASNSKHRAICRDRKGNLWVASDEDGLLCFTLGNSLGEVNRMRSYAREQFGHRWITSLYTDKRDQVWVGTSNGLYKYEPHADNFRKVDISYSYTNLYVSGIIEDFYNNLWVVSIEGLYKITPDGTVQYHEPHTAKDIAKTWYILGLNIDRRNGNIFVGGVNGLICFNPQKIVPDPHHHRLFISGFEILNKPVSPDGVRFREDLNRNGSITLSHRDYQFGITFSSLFYPDPMKIKYAYKLEGFDKNWIIVDASRRYVSYSNLPSGHYTLRIRSSNASGIWLNNDKCIDITIKPSPWRSWQACILYAAMALGILFLVGKIFLLRSKLKYKEELNRWKLSYYINLSYGFKVPLTLMYAPLQSLLKDYDSLSASESRKMLHTMLSNMKKLSFQIAQLTEVRSLESGENYLHLSETDMIALVNDVFAVFREEALSKDIDYTIETNVNSAMAIVDVSKIEITLYNILSNAVKYTPSGGKVGVVCHLSTIDHRLWISVTDTGKGIGDEEQKKLFRREKTHSGKTALNRMPISLSVASDYLRMHHSRITVESRQGEGSVFKFYIQLGNAHFSKSELAGMKANSDGDGLLKDMPRQPISSDENGDISTHGLPLIILYEGDRDLDNFIKSSFHKKYQVKIVDENHTTKQLRAEPLSLVMIDQSHEEEAKLDICRHIKEDPYLSSVPVMFISSLSTEEAEHKAYESGADAYITKPFDLLYLKTRIKQLLDVRRTLKETIKKELIVNPKEISITSDDDLFLANVMNVIESNLSDPGFTIDDLCAQLNLSRSMLYRRISRQTNQSPVEFIKKVRLKRAAGLLAGTSYNVAEISYRVGFSDQRYFSLCFKKEYGMTPKKYSLTMRNQKPVD